MVLVVLVELLEAEPAALDKMDLTLKALVLLVEVAVAAAVLVCLVTLAALVLRARLVAQEILDRLAVAQPEETLEAPVTQVLLVLPDQQVQQVQALGLVIQDLQVT